MHTYPEVELLMIPVVDMTSGFRVLYVVSAIMLVALISVVGVTFVVSALLVGGVTSVIIWISVVPVWSVIGLIYFIDVIMVAVIYSNAAIKTQMHIYVFSL